MKKIILIIMSCLALAGNSMMLAMNENDVKMSVAKKYFDCLKKIQAEPLSATKKKNLDELKDLKQERSRLMAEMHKTSSAEEYVKIGNKINDYDHAIRTFDKELPLEKKHRAVKCVFSPNNTPEEIKAMLRIDRERKYEIFDLDSRSSEIAQNREDVNPEFDWRSEDVNPEFDWRSLEIAQNLEAAKCLANASELKKKIKIGQATQEDLKAYKKQLKECLASSWYNTNYDLNKIAFAQKHTANKLTLKILNEIREETKSYNGRVNIALLIGVAGAVVVQSIIDLMLNKNQKK